MNIEARVERLERQNRRLRWGVGGLLLVGAVAFIVAGGAPEGFPDVLLLAGAMAVFVGQAVLEDIPDVIRARAFHVVGKDGEVMVKIEDTVGPEELSGVTGTIQTFNAKGQCMVTLGATSDGEGAVTTWNGKDQVLAKLGVTPSGGGVVTTWNGKGQNLVQLGASENGGAIVVSNKTGEEVCTMVVDEYGNGRIGAWDRKGKGRTLQPGP